MRKLLFLIISIFSLMLFGCVTPQVQVPKTEPGPEAEVKVIGGINREQPISVGEKIYTQSWGGEQIAPGFSPLFDISYTYMGIDEKNNIRVIRKYDYRPNWATPPTTEQLSLLLPLNPKKQTILKVRGWREVKELLITVVDEFNRITVEEIGKTPIK